MSLMNHTMQCKEHRSGLITGRIRPGRAYSCIVLVMLDQRLAKTGNGKGHGQMLLILNTELLYQNSSMVRIVVVAAEGGGACLREW